MILRNPRGRIVKVTPSMYSYLIKKGWEGVTEAVAKEPKRATNETTNHEWPKPPESGSWWTLSNGVKVRGEAKAVEEQAKLG